MAAQPSRPQAISACSLSGREGGDLPAASLYGRRQLDLSPRALDPNGPSSTRPSPVVSLAKGRVAALPRGADQPADQPTDPSISRSINRFNSIAYSSGSCLATGSMNPRTIIDMASA